MGMGSADVREVMRDFERAWPQIEQSERRYRRSDRFGIGVNLVCGLALVVTAALISEHWTVGFIVGAMFTTGYSVGRIHAMMSERRRSFEQLRTLHEQAEFTLSYHHEDEP